MKVLKYIFIPLLINTILTANDDFNIIDATHDSISKNIILTSKYIDNTLYNLLSDTNNSTTKKETINSIDSFYSSDKFVDETDTSFLRIRVQSNYQNLYENSYDAELQAYIALSKTKKNIKLFIENMNQNNFKDLSLTKSKSTDSSASIGISYLTSAYHNIDSKYSLGIRGGLDTYIKARYKKTFNYNNWIIEPSQSFTYFLRDDFREESVLYLDNKLDKLNLFRIQLSRDSSSSKDGMNYFMALQYFYLYRKNTGISFTQSFSGNTRYSYINNGNLTTYKNINTYNTQISWRQNIWKKWFFYEVKPGIDFQKVNHFKANYKILFLTDFYFGYSN